jgi:hypothetical protein
MGNKIVKPISLFNLAASRRTAATNISKIRFIERWVFFFGIFLCGGDYFNLPKFTDCDSNQQRAGYGETANTLNVYGLNTSIFRLHIKNSNH